MEAGSTRKKVSWPADGGNRGELRAELAQPGPWSQVAEAAKRLGVTL
jgi:hypothetical protein